MKVAKKVRYCELHKKGSCTSLVSLITMAAPTATRKCTMSRWPFPAASSKGVATSNKGAATSFAPWSLAAPFSIGKRGVLRCRLRTVLNDGVHPWANLGSSVALASSDSAVSWTRPCSAAWSKGVSPSLCASLGFRGCFGGQNSKSTGWIFGGAGSTTWSSWISCEPSSTKSLCLNLEMLTLRNLSCQGFIPCIGCLALHCSCQGL